MSQMHEVLRSIPGPEGTAYAPGRVVDVSDWRQRNVKLLVERRYLRPVSPPAPAPSRAGVKRG